MPTMSDVTVVASAYTTSASARPQTLSNGWLVSAEIDAPSGKIYFQVDKRDGGGFKPLCFIYQTGLGYFSLESVGTKVYCVSQTSAQVYSHYIDVLTQQNVDIFSTNRIIVDTGQSNANGISAIINDIGTELHTTWASKNSTYPNSSNIRYAKGTVNADGSVTWGTVEQVTMFNTSGYDQKNPTIFINNNLPFIITEQAGGFRNGVTATSQFADKAVVLITKSQSVGVVSGWLSGTWKFKVIYSDLNYAQYSPSAIFVPQSINGLANGRIKVTWHGLNSTATSYYSIYEAYSDDGGVTWTVAVAYQATSTIIEGRFPSYTVNKDNVSFIVFSFYQNQTHDVAYISNSGSGWTSSPVVIKDLTSNAITYPSTLFDLSLHFSLPLLIYKDSQNSKIGFYGTWTTFTPMAAFSLPSSNQLAKANLDTLRQKVNDFRTANGIATKVWTDPTIITGVTPIKAIHVNELQSAIDEVYSTNQTNYTNSITMGKIKEILSAKSSPLDYPLRVNHLINALQNI